MKEFEVKDYYGVGAADKIGKNDYMREMVRLEEEKKARDKYEADEVRKADIAERERLNKEREKAARDKQLEERKARVEAEKQQIKDEEKERERIKQQRQKAINNFDNLETEELVLLLNDEDDVQIFFEKMFTENYQKFKEKNGSIRDSFEKLPKLDTNNLKEEDLQKADHLFRILFGDLAEIELPYLYALNNGQVPEDNELKDNLIVSNFTFGVRSVEDSIKERFKDKNIDDKTFARAAKLFVLNIIKNSYSQIETRTESDVDDAREEDPEKYKNNKDAIYKQAEEKNLKNSVSKIQYKCFVAEKDMNGKLDIIRPAKDFDKDSIKRKFWLRDNPETEGRKFTQEDLAFQLETVKGFGSLISSEQKLSDAVFNKNTKQQRIPSSLNRKKYELREFRSAFMRQADSCDLEHSRLKTFNEDMAFLCDPEAGDFRKLLREKPHIADLIELVQNGPLLHAKENKTQAQIYDELMTGDENTMLQYVYLTHSIVQLVRAEYKRQEYDRTGWDKDKEQEFKDMYWKAIDNMSYRIDKLSTANLQSINRYSGKDMRYILREQDGSHLKDSVNIITYEMGALARGWNPNDTFMFAMVGAIISKARTLRQNTKDNKEKENYNQIADELYKINVDLDKADTSIKKRDVLERFDAFVRKNVKNTELLAPLNNQQLEYDRVRTKFDEEYKQSVINDLKKIEYNTVKLAGEMIKMQKLALEREENFHDEIFKEYINTLDQQKQADLQKALYTERLEQMVVRGRRARKESDNIFEKKELASLRFNKFVYDNMYSQIGAILSKSDEVEAVDRLMTSFAKPIDKKVKDTIYNAKVDEMSKSAHRTYNGELVHDSDYYNFLSAERMDKPKTDLGITLVTAPDGGFNIKYDKEVSEIRKDVFQRGEAQIEDLSIELAKLRTTANQFLFEIEERKDAGLDEFKYINDQFTYLLTEIAHAEKWALVDYGSHLSFVKEYAEEARNRLQYDNNPVKGEDDFYKRVLAFVEKGFEVISPDRYPDLESGTVIDDYKKEIEITKKLWENKNPDNKWETKPTEELKEKQAAKSEEEKKLDKYYSALSSVVSSKDADYDEGYDIGLFFKPTKILEMVGKCYNALQAIDGDNVAAESEEYQDFYYALKDMKDAYKGKELDPNDGSNKTLDGLTELNRATQAYLNSIDKSKNAHLRKNVADIVNKLYLTKKSGFDINKNFEKFTEWVENDYDVHKAVGALSPDAKKIRQDRIDAEKKAAEDARRQRIEEDQRKRDYTNTIKRINDEASKINKNKSSAQKKLDEERSQIGVTENNINWANSKIKSGIDVGSMKAKIENWNKSLKDTRTKIKGYENEIAAADKQLAALEKERTDAIRKEREADEKIKRAEEKKIADEKAERARRRELRNNPQLAAKGKAAQKNAAPKKEEIKAAPKKEEIKAAPKKDNKKGEPKNAAPKKEEIKPAPKKTEVKIPAPKIKEEINKEEDINIIKVDENKEENIININEPIKEADNKINIIDEKINEEINIEPAKGKAEKKQEAAKAPKAKKVKLAVGYEGYYILHSADKKGRNHKEKVENLAKVMAAAALEGNGKKFSVSKIHDYKDVMMENFNLIDLTEDKLNEYLESPKTAKKALHKLTNEMYRVNDIDAYFTDMKILLDNMKSSKGRSDEYKDMASRIEKTVALKDKIYENDEEKQRAVNYSAFLVSFTVDKYMKGKKSVRTFEGGRDRFDNSLDALAIVSKYAPNAAPRVKKLTDRINAVRNDKNHKINLNEYGAERAKDAKKVRDERKAPKAKNK